MLERNKLTKLHHDAFTHLYVGYRERHMRLVRGPVGRRRSLIFSALVNH